MDEDQIGFNLIGALCAIYAFIVSSGVMRLAWILPLVYLLAPVTLAVVRRIFDRLSDDIPQDFETVGEAKSWLETRGYNVQHKCEPTPGIIHLVGEKYSRVPIFGHYAEVYVKQPEDIEYEDVKRLLEETREDLEQMNDNS